MMDEHPRRYLGTRWQLQFGSYEGVERFAVNELQRMVQIYLPYVLAVEPVEGKDPKSQENLILVGTAENNPRIAELIESGRLSAPRGPQGYSIASFASPWKEDQRVIAIAGFDPAGVLYGVEDFNARALERTHDDDGQSKQRIAFDRIDPFAINEMPLIEYRGIWTWGYVIYDYKRFIDNMARLKMNTLTIWNDCVPLNCREIIDYAHSRGIRVILGFHWGWGYANLDPNKAEDREWTKNEVATNYTRNYRHLGMDGIYFQTFTEHNDLEMGGRSTAALACEWVNEISAALFEIDPELRIEFGLHATSIGGRYTDLKPLDKRVTITWEDHGTLPCSYDPFDPPMTSTDPRPQASYEATVDYAKKLATFRENREFAMVAKGWITLKWPSEFEHHGPFILGERDHDFIARRLQDRQVRWDLVNALWARNYPLAARYYREVLECKPSTVSISALVEDGMFEEAIQMSVAMFAQTVWDPYLDEKDLIELAMSAYYRRRA